MKYEEHLKKGKQIKNRTNKLKLRNGFGSISYLGSSNNRTKPFMMRAPATYDEFGKATRKVIGYTDDYYTAMETLIQYNKDPYAFEKQEMTFEEVAILMFEHKKKRNDHLAPNYKSAFNNQCTDLYKTPIVDITTEMIQDCVDECDLGFTTKKYIKLLCSKVFKHARFLGIYIDSQIVKDVEIGEKEESNLHNPFTQAEKEKLWDNLNNRTIDPHGIIDIILISIYTATRPRETLGILTTNVFLNEKYAIGGLKTISGKNREIPFHDKIIPLIEARYDKRKSFLITDSNNKPYNYRHYLDLYKEVMSNLDMIHYPHDSRITANTEMRKAGIEKVVREKILGHKSQDVSDRYYTTVSLEEKLRAINTIK